MISKGQINISRRMKNSSGFVDNIQAHLKWKRMTQASSREEFNKKQRHISKLRLKRQLPNFEMVSYDDGQNIEWDRWAHTDGWVSCINPGNFEPPQPHYTEWEEKTWPRWNTRPKALNHYKAHAKAKDTKAQDANVQDDANKGLRRRQQRKARQVKPVKRVEQIVNHFGIIEHDSEMPKAKNM